MELDAALAYAADHRTAVLVTLRRDGRAQSSDISYAVVDGAFKISVTESRAKTKNIRRDPRVVLHLTRPDGYSYLSFDGVAELSPVAAAPDDGVTDELVDYYRLVSGEHDNWDEFRQAMVDDGRLLIKLRPRRLWARSTSESVWSRGPPRVTIQRCS